MRSTRRTITSQRGARVRAGIITAIAALAAALSMMGGLPPSPASAASPKLSMGGVFGGYTSKDWPVVIEVSRNGKRVKRATAGIESPCTSGALLSVPDDWRDVPIRKRRFRADYTTAETEGGLLYDYSDSISGALNRKRTRISGSWSERVVVRNAAGATVDTCQSGPVSFTARRE